MKINYRYILIAAVLLVALLSLPTQAKRKKVVVTAAPILSAQDQRRMDSLFLESVCERLKGNDSIARCLLEECRDLNPYAAEPYFFLAKYYADDGNDSLVQAYLEKTVSLRPDNQTYLEALALSYYRNNELDKAAAVYESLARKNRGRTDLLQILLGIYDKQKAYDRMIDCLNRLEQIEGSGEDITLSKVSIYGLKGERKKALASLKQLVAEHPYDINYQVMMGNWLMQNGGESEALKIFTEALAKEPGNANVLSSMYDYYKSVGQHDLADNCLKSILDNPKTEDKTRLTMMKAFIQDNEARGDDSTRVIALFDQQEKLGVYDATLAELRLAYLNLKKFPEAEVRKARTRLLSLEPDNGSVRFELIQSYWKEQNWEEVIKLSKEGTEYNPDELAFYYFLGLSCYQNECNDEALSALRRGVALADDKSNKDIVSDFYSMMGNILHDQNKEQEAFEAFDNCLKWKDDNIECLNNYAYYLSEKDTALNKAAQMSQKTIKVEPKNPTFLDTYAWILYRQDRYAEARIYIDQALANDSDSVQSGVVLEHAGDIYFRNGLTDEAVGYWQRAVKAGGGSELLPKKIKYRKIIEDGDRKKQDGVKQKQNGDRKNQDNDKKKQDGNKKNNP